MSTKKRPAKSTISKPKTKKLWLDKPEKAEKKRSQPITRPAETEGSASDSDEEFTDQDTGGFEKAELPIAENGASDGDSPEAPAAAPVQQKSSRESHKAQKLLYDQRRAAKPHSTLLLDAKRVWSLARQQNIPSEERRKHVQDLMNVIRGNVKDVVLKHDASRIVQTVVKHGRQKERDEVASELKGNYKDLAQSRYSKFLVTKLIRLCPTHRASILQEFQGYVLRLLLHREASSVLADAFEVYCAPYERTILLRDFYGKEATLFTVTSGSDEEKERAKKGLAGILDGADIERKRRVLKAVKENLTTIYNNPDKGAVTHAIVHRVLWEYISALNDIPDETEREKLQREIFETCQDTLAEMAHTKDGSRVVREFLAIGTAKDRKQIIKAIKPHIERMCLDEEAQMVLFTALDVIDDTKLVSKSLIAEITSLAPKLYISPQGRRALLYLIVPRSRRHFIPSQITTLAETDETRARTSKKSPETRENEVRQSASGPLIAWIEQNAATVVRDPGGSLAVVEVMLYAEGDKSSASQALLQVIATNYPAVDAAFPHPIDLPHTSRLYKTLLQGGHFNRTTKSIESASSWDSGAFAAEFVKIVGEDVATAMCTLGEGDGAFVVAELCEALVREGERRSSDRQAVKRWFGDGKRKAIKDGPAKGKNVLLEKITSL